MALIIEEGWEGGIGQIGEKNRNPFMSVVCQIHSEVIFCHQLTTILHPPTQTPTIIKDPVVFGVQREEGPEFQEQELLSLLTINKVCRDNLREV